MNIAKDKINKPLRRDVREKTHNEKKPQTTLALSPLSMVFLQVQDPDASSCNYLYLADNPGLHRDLGIHQ